MSFDPEPSVIEVEVSVISAGGLFATEVFTSPINLNLIKPVFPATSSATADLT